jgi:hypothetical protein
MNRTKMLIYLPITRFTYNSIKNNRKFIYNKIVKTSIIPPKSTVVVPKSGTDLLKYLRKTYNQK